MLEIKSRDAGGRCCTWKFEKYTVNTPQIAIVVNPDKQIIPPKELRKKFNAELLITNAYISKNAKNTEDLQKNGLHRYFEWDGPIYTDSGTYQMYSKGSVDITPQETLDFQRRIGSDIITPLDLFTTPDDTKDSARQKLDETLKRIESARKTVSSGMLVGPVQGGNYLGLRKRAAIEVSKLKPDVYAIGGIVPLMIQYRYRELVNVILTVKRSLSPEKPLHAFGCGHPMVFSLLVALGVDLFDSAAYALYAKDKRYMTEMGTSMLAELKELPCECPVCSSHSPKELDEKLLAEHNLYQTFKEIRTIRHAISEGTLWELVEQRIRAHPRLIEAYRGIKKYNKYLETVEPISKSKAFFETGSESFFRPEIYRVKQRIKGLTSGDTFRWNNMVVPCGLKNTYPIGQSVLINERKTKRCADAQEVLKTILQYQYGAGAQKMIAGDTEIVHSRNTGRIRRVMRGAKLLGTVRANDGMFIPTFDGACELLKYIGKSYHVVVSSDAVPFVRDGKSVFSKFVVDADEKIRPYDEVLIADEKGNLIATGTALMNRREMLSFRVGVAVKTRHQNEEPEE